MRFVATLEHSPDNCWAREHNQDTARAWLGGLSHRAEEHGVALHGAYAAPNEHSFTFVMEAETFDAVSGFLGQPFLQDHDGDVVPVLSIEEVVDTVLED
jgi:hypothetical protein